MPEIIGPAESLVKERAANVFRTGQRALADFTGSAETNGGTVSVKHAAGSRRCSAARGRRLKNIRRSSRGPKYRRRLVPPRRFLIEKKKKARAYFFFIRLRARKIARPYNIVIVLAPFRVYFRPAIFSAARASLKDTEPYFIRPTGDGADGFLPAAVLRNRGEGTRRPVGEVGRIYIYIHIFI